MPNRSKKMKFVLNTYNNQKLNDLQLIIKDLYLISETDSLFKIVEETFIFPIQEELKVIEVLPTEFFDSKIQIHDWFDDFSKNQSFKFQQFFNFLISEVTNLKIYKFGEIEIKLIIIGQLANENFYIEALMVET